MDVHVPQYQRALVASYSYVVSAAVDRLLDLIEYTFLREAGCAPNVGSTLNLGEGQEGGGTNNAASGNDMDIRAAASAAAAGLRVVDGVRMLGPSLSKLCEISNIPGLRPTLLDTTIASALCISLHRSTVKNCSKTRTVHRLLLSRHDAQLGWLHGRTGCHTGIGSFSNVGGD